MSTIAILYPGEMGISVATELIHAGHRVVTHLPGRSSDTRRRASDHQMWDVPRFEMISEIADTVISLVPPSAVIQTASHYLSAVACVDNPAEYIDMNAKSLAVLDELLRMFSRQKVSFANACIIGRPGYLKEEGVIFTSGRRSARLHEQLASICEVRHLADDPQAATAYKMCFAGFSKSIVAALFESAAAANHFGFTYELFTEIASKLPGVMADLDKIGRNFPSHLLRRAEEMTAATDTLALSPIPGHMTRASAQVFNDILSQGCFEGIDSARTELIDILLAIRPATQA